jgi:hypothetical protein
MDPGGGIGDCFGEAADDVSLSLHFPPLPPKWGYQI